MAADLIIPNLMNTIVVDLSISAEQYQRFYSGQAKLVSAISIDGRRVQFPANILQRAVSHDGVQGRFAITFDRGGKFRSIERLNA